MLGNSIILMLLSITSLAMATYKTDESYLEEFRKFVIKFGKIYSGPKEEAIRYVIWKSNLDYINTHNAEKTLGGKSFWLKMNKFGDLVTYKIF